MVSILTRLQVVVFGALCWKNKAPHTLQEECNHCLHARMLLEILVLTICLHHRQVVNTFTAYLKSKVLNLLFQPLQVLFLSRQRAVFGHHGRNHFIRKLVE